MTSSTKVIRVGLIGLSGAPPEEYEGVSWTPSAHLPYLLASPHYQIVALLNSSAASARVAIKRYNLPGNVQAYGNPEDLANDKNVDLVVCSVRVDRHFMTVKPSLEAGKAVFVEWPMEKNLSIAKEMAALAAKSGSKTIVGIQASFDPVLRMMRKCVDEGKLGKLLSSTIFASQGSGGETEVKNVRYFLDREVGGNLVSIRFGHAIETVTTVLGEFKTWETLLSNRHATKDIVDPANGNKVVVKDAPNTVPDQMMFLATTEKDDVPVSIHFRGGDPFPGMPAIEWRIQGSKGELKVTSSSPNLQVGSLDTRVEFWNGKEIEVLEKEKDEWDALWFSGKKGGEDEEEGDEWAALKLGAGNIARLYEAFWKGEWIPDFELGVKRHVLIEEMWERYDCSRV